MILALATACASSGSAGPGQSVAVELDSLSIERGACYGTCDIYQLIIRRVGAATLRRRLTETRVEYRANDARRLLASAVDAGVLSLPIRIRADSTLCPLDASDHATIIFTAYAPSGPRRLEHYTGCYSSHDLRVAPRLERLVIFERRLDALVAVKE